MIKGQIIKIIDMSLGDFKAMGGPGSGHWRHAGRKGKRGGSAPSKRRGLAGEKLSAPIGDIGRRGNQRVEWWLIEKTPGEGIWSDATEVERAELKAQVAKDLAEASGVTEQEAADFVKQWAHSSNDDDMRSLAIQQDAAKEFGVKTSEFTQGKINNITEMRQQHLENIGKPGWPETAIQRVLDDPKYKPLMESDKQRAILRAMYNETQAELKARGITEVRLSRGMGSRYQGPEGFEGPKWERNANLAVSTNALESWSIGSSVASSFAQKRTGLGELGILMEAVTPAERILSIPATGFGCLTEGEVVVLGGVEGDMVNILSVMYPRGYY